MRKTFFLLMLLLNSTLLFSQRNLAIEDRSDVFAVFRSETEAKLVITCSEDIPLTFTYQNKIFEPAEIDTLAGNINYKFVLGTQYRRRVISIHAKNYNPLNLTIGKLEAKQVLTYYVGNPDAIIDCYYELIKEGLKLFRDGMYEDARNKYEMAKDCKDKLDKTEHEEKIKAIDSILIWRGIADAYYDRQDYASAVLYYRKIYTINSGDKYTVNKIAEGQSKESERCEINFLEANRLFKKRKYHEAKKLYEEVIARSCFNIAETTDKLRRTEMKIEDKEQLAKVLVYEVAENTPIGISTGKYKNRARGYFSLRFNPDLFKALNSEIDYNIKPELNVSFGWTIRTVKPVFIFFGPGYTGLGQYAYDENDVEGVDTPSLKIYHAVSPEIGLLGKIKINKNVGIALRYTFQYRFAIEKKTEDYIGNMRHIGGIGLCF